LWFLISSIALSDQINEMGTVTEAIKYARIAVDNGCSVITSDDIGEWVYSLFSAKMKHL
jgi:enolase